MSHPAWKEAVAAAMAASTVRFDAPLDKGTTLRLGGPAGCLVEVESEADLVRLFELIDAWRLPYHVLGRGSNVLVPDAGLPGLVIRLGKAYRQFRQVDAKTVAAGAGLVNSAFIEHCRKAGLGGMEFLIAVPGSVGGAVAMNAGAHGGETAEHVVDVRYFDRQAGVRTEPAEAFAFAYRRSPLRGQEGRVVLEATLRLSPMSDGAIQARKRECLAYRGATQPRDFPNCGSVFKNPPGDHAARLIDACGLKGHQVGQAQVSEKHANFIVNRGGATARHVLDLVAHVRATVQATHGVWLELELQVLEQPPVPAKPGRAAPDAARHAS